MILIIYILRFHFFFVNTNLRVSMGLLTKPTCRVKYDIMKKEQWGGWECN